jgi:signal transduction histidine kinase
VGAFYLWLRRHPRLVDGVLAAALGLAGLASTLAAGQYVIVPLTLALVIPLVFRRDHPVAAFAAGIAVGGLQVLLGIRVNTIDVVILVLLYTLAAYGRRRVSLAGLVICLAGSAVAVVRYAPEGLSLTHWLMIGSVMFAGSSLIAWVLGDSMRYRRGYYASLEDRAARLERERDAQAQIAAAAERARIARELHDVIAHNVSVMVVQADGASYALDNSPERARQALGAIASTGRQALAEMRRMLGVLRSDDGSMGVVPLPGIGQLGELLEQTRASGLAVSFTVQGVPGSLPGGLALAAYRIIQESLTNTRKHGGPRASARVLLRYCEDVLMLQITDDGRGPAVADGAGPGLTGLRDRVARCARARCPAAATRSPPPCRSTRTRNRPSSQDSRDRPDRPDRAARPAPRTGPGRRVRRERAEGAGQGGRGGARGSPGGRESGHRHQDPAGR